MKAIKFILRASVSVFAVAHYAQSVAAQEQDVEAVVVTGTAIVRDGYQTPTPVTVLGAADLEAAAPANIADVVTKLPAVLGSSTNQNSNQGFSGGTVGIAAMNLRNLGSNRTLVLIDGQRSVPSAVTGIVDVNTIPQALVSRVDVVTGGASAVYGSDALAGVVNFVLNKEFVGFKGEVAGGITTYGDDASYKISLTGGTTFAGGRGHAVMNLSTDHIDGIHGNTRKWNLKGKYFMSNPNYTATNGQPRFLIQPGTGFSTATLGGIITGGPLRGTAFGPGGTPYQFDFGNLVSDPFCRGGDCLANQANQGVSLDQKNIRQNAFARVSYDLTDNINVYIQGSYSQATSFGMDVSTFSLANQTVFPDNPFMPASVAARARALGLTSLTMGTFWGDLPPLSFKGVRDTTRGVIGANGTFDMFGSTWKWDGYAQLGFTASSENGYALQTSHARMAIDAVVSPTTGAIVCRSILASPGNGCVPYNIFGTGVNTPEAIAYVDGDGNIAYRHQGFSQKVISGQISGEPFSNWAGPISLALGIQHRRDAVNGSADPDSALRDWYSGNYLPTIGSMSVTEGFLETVVPMFTGFNVNLAARITDYSTSGMVNTFKIGAEYAPFDDVRFRGTRSRDIRAPNLSELYAAGTSGTDNITDPFLNNITYSALTITSGNSNLKPEVATTNSVGVVLTPSFLPGFSASVDYYNINIRGGVGSLNRAQIINNCFQGITSYCSSIIRDPSSGRITQVRTSPFNLAMQEANGLDFEATLTGEVADYVPGWDGGFSLRMLATHYLKNYSDSGTGVITDTVGQNQNVSSNTSFGPPNWVWQAQFSYSNDPWTGTISARGISDGVYANSNIALVGCGFSCPASTASAPTVNDAHIPSAYFFDASLSYKVGPVEFFGVIKNLLDKDPPILAPGTGVPNITQTNVSLYDVLGRNYRAGIRFNF